MALTEEQSEKHCWVCFATERDDRGAEWVSPCRCKGCTKWIHQSCLQRWLDEKQKGNGGAAVNCPQCGTEYCIIFPKMGPLVYFLQQADRALSRASPFAAVGVVVGTVYWSAVTYGAVTVMQVVGHKKGLFVMERADPLFLLMGLPTIPVLLVLGKMIRWEDYLVRLWLRYSYKHGPSSGGHCVRADQRRTESVFQTAAVHHAGQQTHRELSGELLKPAGGRGRGQHRGQRERVTACPLRGQREQLTSCPLRGQREQLTSCPLRGQREQLTSCPLEDEDREMQGVGPGLNHNHR
uniref:E3 ubiquitin-protein ligase MARCHF5 n=1 Tax=Poecilia latipinna TaxID=48699 RepID=A0A3B3VL31_9TELE